MVSVVLEHLTKVFQEPKGRRVVALDDVSLTIREQELLVLVGPSGCGKTTTLRLLAGLEQPTSGVISFDGRVVNEVSPKERDVAMVFQNPALYPHLDAYDNLAFGLSLRRCPKKEIETRVRETADMLGLADCLDRRPMELSGGQRQRVALGRALVRRPKVLLLDEPLSHLDAPMRLQMRAELARLHARLRMVMVYVTHDQAEALALGQRLALMQAGTIQQVGTPMEVYRQPANLFVAGFIGSPAMNFFHGTLAPRGTGLCFQTEPLSDGPADLTLPLEDGLCARLKDYAGKRIILGLRPEHIQPNRAGAAAAWSAEARVEGFEPMGAESYVRLATGSQSFGARLPASESAGVGEKLPVVFALSQAHFFDPGTQRAIH